ncbi:MAG: hypothetical protein K0U08_03770 [Proteobacteria bacterium]|nr:hypothetical protein [Pseudomonadota bacterium]MCH9712180.1 hypothetical protein [Pseudomonadota bacterium]MCH9750453.1 hypothetical protein [Pseudomonadota bacterium]
MINGLLDTEKTHLDDDTNKRIDSGLLGQITDNKEADLSDTQKHKNIFNTDGGLLDVEIK